MADRPKIIGGGASIGFSTGHLAIGVHPPPIITNDWMIIEGSTPISEPQLAELTGRQDLGKRISDEIGSMKTLRNVGIGMTLGGFICAGVASPFFKQGSDEGLTGAGIAVGVGLAVGASGLVVWLLYGPEAAKAATPYPTHHLLTQEEAEDMIESYNETLRRELGLSNQARSGPPGNQAPPVRFSIIPDPRGGVAAALEFNF
ncbi:MAG: hypothetical protein JRJ19_13975 [Deltaproteobacteria bacterium]|nr:hypothetical protein [Deltaproteobacteria bacterium]